MLKRCPSCGVEKCTADFYRSRSSKDGLSSHCKKCSNSRVTAYRQTPRGRAANRSTYIKSRYGVTGAKYAEMLREQGGVCAICEQPDPRGLSLAVDHDHSTGTVRGLLCMFCNTALGKFKDDPELMRRAANYIEKHING